MGAFDASAVHTLGQIGEALLATGTPWQIRRLTATAGDRNAADRRTLKRSLMELSQDPVRVAVFVLLGRIIEVNGELALVTGDEAHEYPEDATLPLSFIRDRLELTRAEQLVVAISARGEGGPLRWLGALGTERAHHIIAVDAPESGNPIADALLAGLCGEALDPRTGTVTMASLSTHLTRHAQTVQASKTEETVAQPPPLAGLWDVRRSQLANRPRPVRADEPEDLTGTVLPGRFRLDHVVARGTFGTVYRARQLAVERDVAVKVLHADIDPSSEDGKLFVHEIRNVGRIDHAHVVRMLQADITHDGRLFFAMELLDGSDLERLGREARLAPPRAIELVRQLLDGLGAAHDAGLVHADIKPANAIVVGRNGKPRSGEIETIGKRPLAIGTEPVSIVSASSSVLGGVTESAFPTPTRGSQSIRTPNGAPLERVVLVDFGLARLRSPDRPAESAGGTPAYMAPEQLREGRVDARSDLFSASLVLFWLITGWRRPNASTLIPPLDLIEDLELRAILGRALDNDPAKRFQSARELSAALTGTTPAAAPEITPLLPFRHLAPMTGEDRGRLHGRESDLALITEHVLYRRSVIYTAPSGTGKTSLLCAGLMPRLEQLGIHAVYHRCRADNASALAAAIDPAATDLAAAIESFHKHRGGKLVIVVDQLEAALGDLSFVTSLLAFDRWPRAADISVLLSVREDYLARLVARSQELEPNIPVVRLPPLTPDGAREAIVTPLAEARLSIEPALLEALLADFQRAAAAIGPEMGWGSTPAVFPPHLQLACSVLYDESRSTNTGLTLDHYRKLGGFDAIVGEHLDRVIETELDDGRDLIARDLFMALVTTSDERAVRPESELLAITNKHDPTKVLGVLETLRSRGLLARVRGDGEPSWELIHDSLVARVRAWIDRKDLARRRAIEMVRLHLRRSTPEAPSLLGRRELRELKPYRSALDELDVEWKKRDDVTDEDWIPTRLVSRSRQAIRHRLGVIASIVSMGLTVGGFGFYRWQVEEQRAAAEASLRARDLGRFTLSLEPFDWDPVALQPIPVTPTLGSFVWTLHSPDPEHLDRPGLAFDPSWVVPGEPAIKGNAIVEEVEAHGGHGFLVITRAGCEPSIVPIFQLPGYIRRDHERPTLAIKVPTCAVSHQNLVEIPAGPFTFNGVGEPPAQIYIEYPNFVREERIDLPAFAMDRTEVTNAMAKMFFDMAAITGRQGAIYTGSANVGQVSHPRVPVSGLSWEDAQAFCRFLGKRLPSTHEWTKALRGGEVLADHSINPAPRRNLPWIDGHVPAWLTSGLVAFVGTHPDDVSPYGIYDLAGNVMEWTNSPVPDEKYVRIVRGANWDDARTLETMINLVAIDNPYPQNHIRYSVGARCASSILPEAARATTAASRDR